MKAAEHDYGIFAYADPFAEPYGAEEVDQASADAGVFPCFDISEKVDDIMVRATVGIMDSHVSEEDHNVAIDCAFRVETAEEADGIVDCSVLRHFNGAAELHYVLVCVGGESCHRAYDEQES